MLYIIIAVLLSDQDGNKLLRVGSITCLLPYRKKKHKTNIIKRRIYRISLASATSFLIGFLLYDLVDVGIVTSQFYWPCFMLVFAGIFLSFKAPDTWSSWMADSSED